ncbi:MAG: DUF4252 domain-containing protein [Pseudomonadota bacterium]
MKKIAVLVSVVLLVSGCGASRFNDGYARFEKLPPRHADRKASISIGRVPIRIASLFVGDDHEAKVLLRNVNGVRVRTWELKGDRERVNLKLRDMRDRLSEDGWEAVAVVQDEGERVYLLMKTKRDAITGVVAIVSESNEVTMVNVMGYLEPEQLGTALAQLDVDLPGVQVARR